MLDWIRLAQVMVRRWCLVNSCVIKGEAFTDQLNDHQLLKKDCISCS
jgi:hypothetical protein